MAGEMDKARLQTLKDIANKLRVHSITMTSAAGSGHPTSCCSAAEIISVLFFNTMRYSIDYPRDPGSDRFVMSKGHAAPILYAAWAEAGLFPPEKVIKELRKIDSDLEGHPTPRLNFVDVATGSLGQGLSMAAGMAYCGKYFDKADYRTYCMVGDAESAEGSIWEACAFSSHYKLDNLVAIFDVNRLGQSDPTSLQHDLPKYKNRLEGFGLHTIVIDGHDVEAVCKAFYEASTVKGKPTAIIAKTFKGRGCPGVEDLENWHGKALGAKAEPALEAINALISNQGPHGLVPERSPQLAENDLTMALSEPPSYQPGQKVAVRVAYGDALVKLGKNNPHVIALDGDTKNSTFAATYEKAFPDRFIECYVAEQNMVGVGIGLACRNRNVVFISAFAAFFSRAYDQIRMGAISQSNVNFVGSHCGISIGEDGPSQMALEDLAMFRAIPTATVFYPSDAVSCERAIELAAQTKGITFTRTSRPVTAILYGNDEPFEIGKAKILRQSNKDQIVLVGCGVTLHECLDAADKLAAEGINATVVDPFTLKPIDGETLAAAAKAAGGKVLTVEDHYPAGGIGEAVAGALCGQPGIVMRRLAVESLPRSGPSRALLDMFGISAPCIVKAAKEMLA